VLPPESGVKLQPNEATPKAETESGKDTLMVNTALPASVKKALEKAVVLNAYHHLAMVVNISLIRRPGEAYGPRALQAASAEVN